MNLTRLLAAARHRLFRAPAGFGRPVPAAAADGEYRSGAWAHFDALPELPRQGTIVAWVCAHRPQPAVLDVGCGSGQLAALFQPHACTRYVGVDFSAEGLALARARDLRGCEFVQGDFETWRPAEAFDAVIFSECLGYARDPGLVVDAFAQSLRPGGVIAVSHFRFGHWAAVWRRIERGRRVLAAVTLTNPAGQAWDVRLLQPATP